MVGIGCRKYSKRRSRSCVHGDSKVGSRPVDSTIVDRFFDSDATFAFRKVVYRDSC